MARVEARSDLGEPFMAVGEDADVEAPEPLQDLAWRCPVAALRFLRAVLVMGCIVGPVLSGLCGAFLSSSTWRACGECGRPLDLWIIVHCLLNLLQTPLRACLLLRLRPAGSSANEVATCIDQLTKSLPWRLCSLLAAASYGWCVIGIVWLLNSSFCAPCPQLFRLMFVVMVLAVAKPAVTVFAFRKLSQGDEEARPPPRAASEAVITRLPIVIHRPELTQDSQTTCAVCICEFEGGEQLRQLPCGHKFHMDCIDTWLRRNKACPLCLHDAELPPPQLQQQKVRLCQWFSRKQ